MKTTTAVYAAAGALASVLVVIACSNSNTSDEPALLGGASGGGGAGGGGGGSDNGGGLTGDSDGSISGGIVSDASVTTLATLPASAVGLYKAPSDKLFAACEDGVIRTIDSTGAVLTVGPVLARASQVLADSMYVYVLVSSTSNGSDGSIMRIDRSDSTVLTLASSLLSPSGLATDGASVYWLDGGIGNGVRIASTPIGGGPLTSGTTLASYSSFGTSVGLYLSGTNANFTVVQNSQTQVFSANLTNPSVNNLATLLGQVSGTTTGLAVDDSDVFLTLGGGAGSLLEVSRADAGLPTSTLVSSQNAPIGLTISGTELIWVDSVAGTVQAYDPLSGLSGQLASGFPNATAATLGDAYYIAYNSGVIGAVSNL